VEARCAPEVALERLARRRAQDRDASDAGPDLYPLSAARFEPFDESSEGERRSVSTDAAGWERLAAEIAAELGR
jgi:predicted kinase